MMSSTCIVRRAVVRKPGLGLRLVTLVLILVFVCKLWSWSWSCCSGLGLGLKNLVLFTSLPRTLAVFAKPSSSSSP